MAPNGTKRISPARRKPCLHFGQNGHGCSYYKFSCTPNFWISRFPNFQMPRFPSFKTPPPAQVSDPNLHQPTPSLNISQRTQKSKTSQGPLLQHCSLHFRCLGNAQGSQNIYNKVVVKKSDCGDVNTLAGDSAHPLCNAIPFVVLQNDWVAMQIQRSKRYLEDKQTIHLPKSWRHRKMNKSPVFQSIGNQN